MKAEPVPDLARLIDDSPVASIITDPRLPDNPIVLCNAAFEKLSGYRLDEIVGRNCRFLNRGAADAATLASMRETVAQGMAGLWTVPNYRKDGSQFINAVMILPLRGDDNMVTHFLGSQIDVSANPTLHDVRADQARALMAGLTSRQHAVLGMLATGLANKQIAHELGIGIRMVKLHRASLMQRLGVRTNAELIRIAVEAGL